MPLKIYGYQAKLSFLPPKQTKKHNQQAKMRGQNWDDLRFVLSVARAHSFASAARHLGVNESTVSRRIARVERHLSARLFERHPSMLTPTEAGTELIQRAERIELEVQAAERLLSGTNERAAGIVRITSVPLIVNHVLVPALPSILKAHPHLKIALIADPHDLSLTKREADIALRLARPRKEVRAIARRIGNMDYAVYGTARLHKGALPWISYEDSLSDLPQSRWIAEKIADDSTAEPKLLVNDAETILRCVKAGIGKSLLPLAIGERTPALIRLEMSPPALSRELWLMVHPELRDLIRIRVVMDWISHAVSRFLRPGEQ